MDKVTRYKQLIQEEMEYQASIRLANMPDVASKLFVGEDKKQFILLYIGWQDKRYLHHFLFNIEIIGDKVWVHEDATDISIADKLIERGIPKEDIVLGFVPMYARDIEGFAVG